MDGQTDRQTDRSVHDTISKQSNDTWQQKFRRLTTSQPVKTNRHRSSATNKVVHGRTDRHSRQEKRQTKQTEWSVGCVVLSMSCVVDYLSNSLLSSVPHTSDSEVMMAVAGRQREIISINYTVAFIFVVIIRRFSEKLICFI